MTTLKAFSTAFIFLSCVAFQAIKAQNSDPWLTMNQVMSKITSPTFKDKDFIITDYGAVGDGITDCSKAIKKAIKACNKSGGGRVIVPAGKYCTGPIYIKSNVNLHLHKEAVLLFSTHPNDYLPLVQTRWEGIDVMNYSPLIYAFNERNIAVTGEGTLDGQAAKDNWWPWKGRKSYGWKEGTPNQTDPDKRATLFEMAEKDIPVSKRKFGNGYYLRPQFIQPYQCTNVLLQGVTVVRSPMWVVHPVLCNNVSIIGVKVMSDGPNTDGCDPESCKDVLIKDCYFDTGDDCIALKSGRNRDGRRINIPCENVIIQNCTTRNGHAGIAIGSEISGGVKNVFIENCKISKPMWGIRIKTSSMRGGVTENIYMRNIEMDKIGNEAIIFTMLYEDKGPHIPTIKDVYLENIVVENGGKGGIFIEAYSESPIKNIHFKDVIIKNTQKPLKLTNTKEVTFTNTFIDGEKLLISPKLP
ncbi:glycoside hydrolase family 28 protein [Bacteroides sp. 224]|uniref:glycoside hydrolase family 28 protein n=1 Tax=Bacteroides sp. 224 TaxID=2302936 RepID=UPI0013D3377B|nr:glycoside hydrolase family 28 protein [Bacteroides sp. 224]NDV64756.1 glycoside hydrolase family 28 protein [Bacteroides sp. 224]